MGGALAFYATCMTCEVAILNRRGVALAAAASNAIFPISSAPVAIMTLGASMMDIPWEVIAANYIHHLGERTFATIDEYADDFFSYIEMAGALFPPQKQIECFSRCVRSIWSDYSDRMHTCGDSLGSILAEDRRELLDADDLCPANFGDQVVQAYASALDELESEIFGYTNLTDALRAELRATVAQMYGKDWCHPSDDGYVIFAGTGSDEPFPSVLAYAVSTVVAGRLRRARRDVVRIGPDCDAGILPFGRRETIDLLIDGIHPDLLAFANELQPHGFERQPAPFVPCIAELSRRGLARIAESLVMLSAVDEPIQLALLAKNIAMPA